eukprot:SAG31_NODE_9742_length_1234_cov_1.139207_3_plen_26_part_01
MGAIEGAKYGMRSMVGSADPARTRSP